MTRCEAAYPLCAKHDVLCSVPQAEREIVSFDIHCPQMLSSKQLSASCTVCKLQLPPMLHLLYSHPLYIWLFKHSDLRVLLVTQESTGVLHSTLNCLVTRLVDMYHF